MEDIFEFLDSILFDLPKIPLLLLLSLKNANFRNNHNKPAVKKFTKKWFINLLRR